MRLAVLLAVLYVALGMGALVTNPDDSRQWQGATVGDFALLFYGANTASNRQLLIDNEILDDGILTADISQTGTLVPTSWANYYAGCRGASYDIGLQYTCTEPKSLFELANAVDEFWFQSSETVGNTVWDLGVDAPQAAIFVSVDHGPLPGEVIESSHYLSDSPTGDWELTEVVKVYLQGYLPDGDNTGLYDGFAYVVRHPTLASFRYISSIHGGPGALRDDGDDEINGVAALDLEFVPVRPAFNVCINASTTISGSRHEIKPILLSGRWTANVGLNYAYDLATRSYGSRGIPQPRSNRLMVFFAQDYANVFSLNLVLDSNDGTGGSATIRLSTSNLGSDANVVVYDDPTSAGSSDIDSTDTFSWYPSTGQGEFSFTWGATTTDGLAIAPVAIATASRGFTIQIEVVSSTGLNGIDIMTQLNASTITAISAPINETLTIVRESCYCGNGRVDALEQCDGGVCCTTDCTYRLGGYLCRAEVGDCDLTEYCNGTSATCPPDQTLSPEECGNSTDCPPGWRGINCTIPICSHWSNCSTCTDVPECGWCCSSSQCLPGNAAGPTSSSCPAWQFSDCGCNPTCSNGASSCECGKCKCQLGRTGADCSSWLGCDGMNYTSQADLPLRDACGVCNGTNSTCMGCDGVPFGKSFDYCGVCGGNGDTCSEFCAGRDCESCMDNDGGLNCNFCKSDGVCFDTEHSYDCADIVSESSKCDGLFGDLTTTEVAGIGAGVIAGIVIAAAAVAIACAVGGKKGFDFYKKRQASFEGVSNNPLYQDDKRQSENPFYSDDKA